MSISSKPLGSSHGTVLIASDNLLAIWATFASSANEVLAVPQEDVTVALDIIRQRQPALVVLEEAFAVRSRAAALIARLRRQAAEGSIDPWTIRKLAGLRDNRAASAMREAFVGAGRRERIGLAGALLIYGEPGRSSLRDLAGGSVPDGVERPGAGIARAALELAVPTALTVNALTP